MKGSAGLLFVLLLSPALHGCRSTATGRSPGVPVPGRLEEDKRRIASTPMIDSHVHTFNGLYLPLEGLTLGKRDKWAPVSWLVPDALVRLLAGGIAVQTRRNQDVSTAGFDDKAHAEADKLNILSEGGGDSAFSLPGKIALRMIISNASDEKGPFRGLFKKDSYIAAFLESVMRRDDQQLVEFLKQHQGSHGNPLRLVFSHMMDMAPVYDQPEGTPDLWDFTRTQIGRMQEQVRASSGRMAYFVAYNPFRDHWKRDASAGPGHALNIVEDAIRNRGAFGVKFYPPSGYRPFANDIKPTPSAWFTTAPDRQWRARYQPGGVPLKNTHLDERCFALLHWCALPQNSFPVFAHCNAGEFEARKGYGPHHADPAYWRQLLEADWQNPGSDHHLQNLRLCLAHAGGPSDWFDEGNFQNWGRQVYDLCIHYPKIYCEVGIHEEIMDAGKRARFVKRVVSLIEESRRTPGACDFAKKIFYGSDWYMPLPKVTGRHEYLENFQQAAMEIDAAVRTQTGGGGFYEDFFLRNALAYANAEKRQHDPQLDPALRRTLTQLLQWSGDRRSRRLSKKS